MLLVACSDPSGFFPSGGSVSSLCASSSTSLPSGGSSDVSPLTVRASSSTSLPSGGLSDVSPLTESSLLSLPMCVLHPVLLPTARG